MSESIDPTAPPSSAQNGTPAGEGEKKTPEKPALDEGDSAAARSLPSKGHPPPSTENTSQIGLGAAPAVQDGADGDAVLLSFSRRSPSLSFPSLFIPLLFSIRFVLIHLYHFES